MNQENTKRYPYRILAFPKSLHYRGTSIIRKRPPLGPYRGTSLIRKR